MSVKYNECDKLTKIQEEEKEEIEQKSVNIRIVQYFIDFKKNKENSCCGICFDKNKLITTKCKHHFHYKCLNDWIKIQNNCPICRKNKPISNKYFVKIKEEEEQQLQQNLGQIYDWLSGLEDTYIWYHDYLSENHHRTY